MMKRGFLIKLDADINEFDKSIDAFNPEMETYTSILALKRIKAVFLYIKSNIELNNDDIITSQLHGISHHLVDQWPFNSKLGNTILDVYYSYKKLK